MGTAKVTLSSKPGELTIVDKYCSSLVKHPVIHCGTYWFCILFVSAVVVVGGHLELQELTFKDFIVNSAEQARLGEAFSYAVENNDAAIAKTQESDSSPRSEVSGLGNVFYMYEPKDENSNLDILSPENIQSICEAEKVLMTLPDYPLFCQTDKADGYDTVCKKQVGILPTHFYDDPNNCTLLSEEELNEKVNFLKAVGLAKLFFDDIENPTRLRSQIFLGGPLGNDTVSNLESYVTDIDAYRNFFKTFQQTQFDVYGMESTFFRPAYLVSRVSLNENLNLRFFGFTLDQIELLTLLEADQLLSGAAMWAVGFCAYLHVKSIFICTVAMFSILFSLPVSLFIYRVVFQIDYFNNLHVIVIFIILGIGADNLFVLVDAFKQSAYLVHYINSDEKETNILVSRLSYAYKRSAESIMNTAFTTAAAFIATGVSPVKPVAAFGYYAGIVVLVNFLWVLTVHPSLILVHHFYFSNCCSKDKSKISPSQDGIELIDEASEEAADAKSWFFEDVYIPIMMKHKAIPATCILALSLSSVFLLLQAVQLETPSKQEANFSPKHMFTGFYDDFIELFSGGSDESFMEVNVVWGISGLDTTGIKKYSQSEFLGVAVYDEEFDLASSESQQYILDICEELYEVSCDIVPGCSTDKLVLENTLKCFMEDFHNWHNSTYKSFPFLLGDDNPTEFYNRLKLFLSHPLYSNLYSKSVGFVQGRASYASVSYRSTMKSLRPRKVKEPVLNLIEDLTMSWKADAPVGLKSVFQNSFDLVWINTEIGLVNGLFNGIFISFVITYCVLLAGTRNIKIATFAIFSVISIVGCVLGLARLLGWELGMGEAIAGVMVIGLSVDYVVHLGHMYRVAMLEGIKKREDRFSFSVSKMGPTVFAGAVTTGASSIFLFLCQLQFFTKMATLIMSTVVFSYTYALFFFLPLCLLFGPHQEEQ